MVFITFSNFGCKIAIFTVQAESTQKWYFLVSNPIFQKKIPIVFWSPTPSCAKKGSNWSLNGFLLCWKLKLWADISWHLKRIFFFSLWVMNQAGVRTWIPKRGAPELVKFFWGAYWAHFRPPVTKAIQEPSIIRVDHFGILRTSVSPSFRVRCKNESRIFEPRMHFKPIGFWKIPANSSRGGIFNLTKNKIRDLFKVKLYAIGLET